MYDRPEGVNPTSNHPLRAGKGNNYEGGCRVPLIVTWPGVVEPGSGSDAINISYDWFPTFLDILNQAAPDGWPLDGVSLLPAFRGEPLERGPIYSMFGHTVLATGNISNIWMRDRDWKLLRFFHTGPDQTHELELDNLSRDPGEINNLAAAHPEIAAVMDRKLTAHLRETATLLPLRNPNYDPEFRQAGIKMLDGGYLIGGPNQNETTITSKGPLVSLEYAVKAGIGGKTLTLSIMSNCVTSLCAGGSEMAILSPPVPVKPDSSWQQVTLRLPHKIEGSPVTIHLDLEQPGMIQLKDFELK